MYDALTARYTFSCPLHGESKVRLSAFRALERLPGAVHPAVFSVRFCCSCGEDHAGLVAHDELDWLPLGLDSGLFLNLMTAKLEAAALELGARAAAQIQGGEWPWSFFCYPEERPRPVFPSSFFLLAPGASRDALAVAVRCPACSRISVNLVSQQHLDLPFHNDRRVGVLEHVFPADLRATLEEFRAELHASTFDARRLDLE